MRKQFQIKLSIYVFFIDLAYESFYVYMCCAGSKSQFAKLRTQTFLAIADWINPKRFPVNFDSLEERLSLDRDY